MVHRMDDLLFAIRRNSISWDFLDDIRRRFDARINLLISIKERTKEPDLYSSINTKSLRYHLNDYHKPHRRVGDRDIKNPIKILSLTDYPEFMESFYDYVVSDC